MAMTGKVLCGVLVIWISVVISVDGYIQQEVADLKTLSIERPLQMPVEHIQQVSEAWTRASGSSGLKQIRRHHTGTKTYYSESYEAEEVASFHSHYNRIRTTGMGEIVAVLNGVEFRTRHIDYAWLKSKQSTADYLEVEPIAFPPVPQSVLDQQTVIDQALELREYYRAWMNHDSSIRDYAPYFKPLLCYLEGVWTNETMSNFTEPKYSETEWIDAISWSDLYANARYQAYSGAEPDRQRFAYLPHAALGTDDSGSEFVYGQWNYRILCHPLQKQVPVNRFRVIDDLVSRIAYQKTVEDYEKLTAVRFRLNPKDSDDFFDGSTDVELLDELMAEIPGLDNYDANIADDSFDTPKFDHTGQAPLNAGFYHRYYKVQGPSGMELKRRSFSDENIFFAMTSQPTVAGRTVEAGCDSSSGTRVCAKSWTQKWSFAIPLTIQYLTPVYTWNPLNIEHKGNPTSTLGSTVQAGGRWGGKTLATALNGTNDNRYYKVPPELYRDYTNEADAATQKVTDGRAIGVLSSDGQLQYVYNHFNYYIPGLGLPRLMYPIVPLHVEGTGIWKELEALKELLLNPKEYPDIVRESTIDFNEVQVYGLGIAEEGNFTSRHSHTVRIPHSTLVRMYNGEDLWVSTSITQGHGHVITAKYDPPTEKLVISRCDYSPAACVDGHQWTLTRII